MMHLKYVDTIIQYIYQSATSVCLFCSSLILSRTHIEWLSTSSGFTIVRRDLQVLRDVYFKLN